MHPATIISETSSARDNSNACTHDERMSGVMDTETYTKSSLNSHLSKVVSTESNHKDCQSIVQAKDQLEIQTSECTAPVRNGDTVCTSNELIPWKSVPNHPANVVSSRSSLPVVDISVESQQIQSDLASGQPDDKVLISAERLLPDGYNWRKYGQKLIKGSNFTRSYYRCSSPNCQAKRQLERSHNGQITEVIYKGEHDHPKPHPSIQTTVRAVHSIQEERCVENPFSKSTGIAEMPVNGRDHDSQVTKHNGVLEISSVVAGEVDVEIADAQPIRILRDVDDPKFKRRCLETCGESTPNSCMAPGHQSCETSVQVKDSIADMNSSRVPLELDSDVSRQKWVSDISIQAVQSDKKQTNHLLATGRLWGDGYNWRKYGQKHIKGSAFPRSYYRCTHPNCQVKKQLERSHDGQIAEVIYKGKHEHPKPQNSSHTAVDRILSIEEEKADRFASLNTTDDKSVDEHGQTYHHGKTNATSEHAFATVSDEDVRVEGPRVNGTENEDDFNMVSKSRPPEINENDSADALAALSELKSMPSVNSVKENMAVSSHESTPAVTVRDSPIYMVTLRGIVPVEAESDESRLKQSSDGGVETTQPIHLGPPITDERMLEKAFHWRKYGQKNIKGSEFPRSYYRCTHPNCQVKMQLERSHDGRIIDKIYKGKHDHPKPQPLSRMAIGAILSIEDEKFDRSASLNSREKKSSNEDGQRLVLANPNGSPELSPVTVSDDDIEGLGEKMRTENEPEDDNDPESKRRKKEGSSDLTIVGRSTREPRLVVETLSEVDVVDDGYRWQKYGRKMVKGNPHPRNYYKCSNSACSVKKHVERASHNPNAVITTYEGKHNHGPPVARATGHEPAGSIYRFISSQGTQENDFKVGNSGSRDSATGTEQKVVSEPGGSESKTAHPNGNKLIMSASSTVPNVHINGGVEVDGNKLRSEQVENHTFETPVFQSACFPSGSEHKELKLSS